ncbi:MAG: RluA family pseudouridine synthase [Candidatus Omnitrophica bacterium]|nr:RluA family pseudouridine synthase [Candidatus Omnitrophota bacterium]
MNIPVVYEDDWLLVVDKPAGLLTIPTPKNESRTLTSILNDDLEARHLTYRLHPCHRLDRDTSGLIIYAKGKSFEKKMAELFRLRKIKKTYIAFVQGNLKQPVGRINSPIEGLTSETKYKVIEKRKIFDIVEVHPLTGRTNQIRIHFKNLGHPILGDTKFAFRRDFLLKSKRLCLHAERLEFVHPETNRPVILKSALPKELKDFLIKNS